MPRLYEWRFIFKYRGELDSSYLKFCNRALGVLIMINALFSTYMVAVVSGVEIALLENTRGSWRVCLRRMFVPSHLTPYFSPTHNYSYIYRSNY